MKPDATPSPATPTPGAPAAGTPADARSGPATSAAAGEATARPASPFALFIAFSLLALQGFGGVLAVAQRELVDRRGWLSRHEFIELYAVAQLLPGPNVVNLSLMVGDRYFGGRGAFAAITGMLLAPIMLVLVLAASYQQLAQYPAVAGALRGMGAVAAGLILAMALKMLATLRGNVLGPLLCTLLGLGTLAMIAVFRLPLAWVVIGLGLSGWGLARWRIAIAQARVREEDERC